MVIDTSSDGAQLYYVHQQQTSAVAGAVAAERRRRCRSTSMGGGSDRPISPDMAMGKILDDDSSSPSSSSNSSISSEVNIYSPNDVQSNIHDSFRSDGCLEKTKEAEGLEMELGGTIASTLCEDSIRAEAARLDDGVFQKDASVELQNRFQKDGIEERRRRATYLELLNNYERTASLTPLQDAKNTITRYKPGDWIEHVGDVSSSEYDIPTTTTLLLVGPRGSGKSSLVNRISRALEDEPHLPDRAQVSYNLSAADGTCFLREYMIPRYSTSFCLYDTRSLSENASDNFKLLKMWMTRGVRHGEMVLRNSDSTAIKAKIKATVRQGSFSPAERRRVDFVIFVVDGISVLKSIVNENKSYTDVLVETFNYPFMSFKDNKPAVVVTHGDQLSVSERARVCTHLGELLGIPPTKQIFDIPDTSNPETDLGIVDMLLYSLQQADRNLPCKQNYLQTIEGMLQKIMDEAEDSNTSILIAELFLLGCIALFINHLVLKFFINW